MGDPTEQLDVRIIALQPPNTGIRDPIKALTLLVPVVSAGMGKDGEEKGRLSLASCTFCSL